MQFTIVLMKVQSEFAPLSPLLCRKEKEKIVPGGKRGYLSGFLLATDPFHDHGMDFFLFSLDTCKVMEHLAVRVVDSGKQ